MTGPGQTMFEFVRHWARRPLADGVDRDRGRLVLVCEAVQALLGRGAPATVGAIAREIGVDQSGASRSVTEAVASGHLALSPSARDGRRREARLTPAGEVLLGRAHAWQELEFLRLTEGWGDDRRRDLQRAMTELMERSRAR